jgi:hypothetical protein
MCLSLFLPDWRYQWFCSVVANYIPPNMEACSTRDSHQIAEAFSQCDRAILVPFRASIQNEPTHPSSQNEIQTFPLEVLGITTSRSSVTTCNSLAWRQTPPCMSIRHLDYTPVTSFVCSKTKSPLWALWLAGSWRVFSCFYQQLLDIAIVEDHLVKNTYSETSRTSLDSSTWRLKNTHISNLASVVVPTVQTYTPPSSNSTSK